MPTFGFNTPFQEQIDFLHAKLRLPQPKAEGEQDAAERAEAQDVVDGAAPAVLALVALRTPAPEAQG